jgi:hypothetical protein
MNLLGDLAYLVRPDHTYKDPRGQPFSPGLRARAQINFTDADWWGQIVSIRSLPCRRYSTM